MTDDNFDFDDVKLAQLMASRLCHDLVGPLGAISAGLELVGETAASGDVDMDALALASKSAAQMTAKLTFLRVAFGAGGGGGANPLGEARALTEKWLAGGGVELDWGVAGSGGEGDRGLAKLALNMVLIGAEALARGGRLTVALAPDGATLEVRAQGPKVLLKDDLAAALNAENAGNPGDMGYLDGISARAVQGVFCARLAAALGGTLAVRHDSDLLLLRAGPLLLRS